MEYILVGLTVYLLYYLKNKYWQTAGVEYKHNVLGNKQFNTNKTSYLALLVLILFLGFRGLYIGGDTPVYYENFVMTYEAGSVDAGYGYGLLYQLITLLSGKIFGLQFGFIFSLIVFATITCVCINYSLKQVSNDFPFAMFMFAMVDVYLRSFCYIRQGVAIAILSIAFVMFIRRKPLHFVACVLTATMFHTSAVLFLLVWPLSMVKNRVVIISVMPTLTLLFGLFHMQIMKAVSYVFGARYYEYYIDHIGVPVPYSLFEVGVLIASFAVLLFILYFVHYGNKADRRVNSICFNSYMLYSMFKFIPLFIGYSNAEIYGRMMYYFSWIIIIAVPNIVSNFKSKYKIVFKILLICACVACAYLLATRLKITPYAPFWS